MKFNQTKFHLHLKSKINLCIFKIIAIKMIVMQILIQALNEQFETTQQREIN